MYRSKYYTCEEIDERLLRGYYNDAVSNGYFGTLDQFKLSLASEDFIDMYVISRGSKYNLQQAIDHLSDYTSSIPSGFKLRYFDSNINAYITIEYDNDTQDGMIDTAENWRAVPGSLYLTMVQLNTNPSIFLQLVSNYRYTGLIYIKTGDVVDSLLYIYGNGQLANHILHTNHSLTSDGTTIDTGTNTTIYHVFHRFFSATSVTDPITGEVVNNAWSKWRSANSYEGGTVEILDGSITTIKLADAAVTQDKLATDSVITSKISNGSVTNEKIADNAVSTSKIQDYTITSLKLATGSVTTDKIANGTITESDLSADLVSKINSGGGSGGGGTVEGDYLRKDIDDIATGKITFSAGLIAYLTSEFDKIIANNINVSDTITTKNLEVTGTAHFFQLIIDQIRSVGGRVLLSLASCKAAHVSYLTSSYSVVSEYDSTTVKYFRVYFCANDGDSQITNNFVNTDMVVCQTFNAATGTSYDVSNKYYWRCIKNCSYTAQTYSFDDSGKEYYYIDLYNYDPDVYYDGDVKGIPEVGDTIVQLGNTSDDTRASAIILSAYNDTWLDSGLKAPCIAQYKGVGRNSSNRFYLPDCRHTWLSLESNNITGQFTVVTAEGNKDIVNYINDRVTEAESSFQVTTDEISSRVTSVEEDYGNLNESYQEVSGNLQSLAGVVNGIPIKTNTQLTEYTSNITQTSKEISLEVSETVNVRRNLLTATQYWKIDNNGWTSNAPGEGDIILRTSDRIHSNNAIEISYTGTSTSIYPGIYFPSIPVTPGKKYTISTYAKRLSSTISANIIYHFFGDVGGTKVSQNRVNLLTSTDTLGEWVLVKDTITIPSGVNFVNVIFCLSAGTTGTFRLAETMMEEGEDRTYWSPSVSDYTYIMGNLIPNTDTLELSTDGITSVGSNSPIEDEDEQGIRVSKATATATYNSTSKTWTSGNATIFAFKKGFANGMDYVFSFYAKRSSSANDTAYISINFLSNIMFSELYDGTNTKFSQEGGSTPYSGYFQIKNIPTEWTKYWLHFRTNAGVSLNPNISIYVDQGKVDTSGNIVSGSNVFTCLFKKPKLEYGALDTEWRAESSYYEEDASVANKLKRTGIDIQSGVITLSADRTVIDGDLHLKGVLVENYAENTDDFIICDLVNNKSVSVYQSDVVLPMISNVTITRGTSTSYQVNGIKEAGVKLTIAAKYDPYVAKWATGTSSLYTDSVMETFHSHLTTVIADPRIASYANYASDGTPIIDPLGGGGYEATNYEGGVFVCNGRRGRILLLMPGQVLHLTSAIEQINGKDVLLWYVDNSSDFVPIRKKAIFWAQSSYTCLFTTEGGSAWPMELGASSGSEYMECMFGVSQLSAPTSSSTTPDLDIHTY